MRRASRGGARALRALLAALVMIGLAVVSARAEEARVGLMTLETPPGGERALRTLAARATQILPDLETDLGIRYRAPFRMFLIPESGPGADSGLISLDAAAPEWAAGYMIPSQRVGAIRAAQASRYPYGTLESVLAHEATHLLIHDSGAQGIPLWFDEGVATWEGRRWSLADAMIYSGSLLTSDLPSLAGLDPLFHATAAEAELAYAASFAFVSRSVHQHGHGFVRDLLRESQHSSFPVAWRRVAGRSLEEDEASWRRDSLIRYRWLPILTASSTLWIGITFLALFVGARRRERARRQREAWASDEDEPLEWAEGEAPPEPADPARVTPPIATPEGTPEREADANGNAETDSETDPPPRS